VPPDAQPPTREAGRSSAAVVAAHEPGRAHRVAAGAWHVIGGFLFLVRHARLWPIAALPGLLCLFLVGVGGAIGLLSLASVEGLIAPRYAHLSSGWQFAMMLAVWTATIALGVLAGLGLSLLLGAPILDHLSRRTEELLLPVAPDRSRGLRWELLQSFRSALFFVAMLPLSFAVGLLPFVGPPLQFTWAAHALASQQSDGPLLRRGLAAEERRRWRRDWRFELLGFGAAGLVTLIVPFANVLLAPGLAVGMARLVVELEALGPEHGSVPSTPSAA
jgi:uncharacterized protein involved in cysteine biosynthesis